MPRSKNKSPKPPENLIHQSELGPDQKYPKPTLIFCASSETCCPTSEGQTTWQNHQTHTNGASPDKPPRHHWPPSEKTPFAIPPTCRGSSSGWLCSWEWGCITSSLCGGFFLINILLETEAHAMHVQIEFCKNLWKIDHTINGMLFCIFWQNSTYTSLVPQSQVKKKPRRGGTGKK